MDNIDLKSPDKRNTTGKTGRKRIALIIFSAAMVLSVAVIALIILNPQKTARDFYLNTEARNFYRYADAMKSSWRTFNDEQREYLDNPYRSRTEVSAEIESDDEIGSILGIDIPRGILDIVGKCKFIIDTGNRYADKESVTNIAMLIDSAPLLDIGAVTKGNMAYLSVPVLLPDRYFSIDLDNVDQVYEKFYLLIRPSRIVLKPDIAAAIDFDGQRFDEMAVAYGDFLKEYIGQDDVSYGGEADFVLKNGSMVKGREIIVAFDAQEAEKLLRELLIEASSDDLLSMLFHHNISSLISLFSDAGYIDSLRLLAQNGYLGKDGDSTMADMFGYLDSLDESGVADAIDKFLNDTADRIVVNGEVRMKLIADRNGNLLAREVTIPMDSGDGERINVTVSIRLNSLEGDICKNSCHKIDIEQIRADGQVSTYVFEYDSDFGGAIGDADEKGTVVAVVSGTGEVNGSVRVSLDIDIKRDRIALTEDRSIAYSIGMTDENGSEVGIAEGDISVSSRRNDKQRTINTVTLFKTDLSLPSGRTGTDSTGVADVISLKLRFANETRFGYDFELPTIASASVTDLNALDSEGISDLQKQMIASFGMLYLENMDLFGALLGED